jgi:hypothetical protein
MNLSSRERKARKLTVLTHYSGGSIECNCCGEREIEFLSLDHVKGGGNQHRKQIGEIYKWAIDNGFPSGFQVLCMNCNWGRNRFEEGCPHRRVKSGHQRI